MTASAVDTAKQSTMRKVMELAGLEAMTERRYIDVQYGKGTLKQVEVRCVTEQVEIQYDAGIRAHAVHKSWLERVKREEILFPDNKTEYGATFEDKVLTKARAARRRLNVLLGQLHIADRVMEVVTAEASLI